MRLSDLERLTEARGAGRPVALLTWLATGRQRVWQPGEGGLDPALESHVERALADDRSAVVAVGPDEVFVHVFNAPLRLIIVGAVHIAQPLARMGALAGFAVTIVDPRRGFADSLRFPGIDVVSDWPDDALTALAPDRRTAVVTLTHDPKLDDPALTVALRSPAFFIGSLGSRRTHGARLSRLRDLGFDQAALDRIHGPVGLDIGALSPAEIALAIMAEIVQTRRGPRREREAA